jgi:phosphoglycolate phosphatase-like HAD superfamily hydrolase
MTTTSGQPGPARSRPGWAAADAYLFDIDGTLLNVRGGVHYDAFLNAMRDVFGVSARLEGVPIPGNTDTAILRAVLRRAGIAEAEIKDRLPLAVRQMSDEVQAAAHAMRPVVCPSVPDLLARLRAAGKLLGVVSGNFEAIGWTKLAVSGLREFFSFGHFSDHAETRAEIFHQGVAEARRRLGPAAAVCVVGDTPADIAAAREVGIAVISVGTGMFPLADLAALAPDHCAACCTDLLAAF